MTPLIEFDIGSVSCPPESRFWSPQGQGYLFTPTAKANHAMVVSHKKIMKHKLFNNFPFMEFFLTLNPLGDVFILNTKSKFSYKKAFLVTKVVRKGKLMGTNFCSTLIRFLEGDV